MLGEAIAQVVGKVIDRVAPDPAAKQAMTLELAKMEQAGELEALRADLQAMQMQADINQIEAASSDPFVARWRPFIGWVCGCAVAWQFFVQYVVIAAFAAFGTTLVLPAISITELLGILLPILGLGAYRSFDKKNGHK